MFTCGGSGCRFKYGAASVSRGHCKWREGAQLQEGSRRSKGAGTAFRREQEEGLEVTVGSRGSEYNSVQVKQGGTTLSRKQGG